ncbi:MAG: PspC domain-containing protein [Propionibacteriales bacterium]|nr:PspC domain-containing protein [Propionibacteriales bacterium]
MTSELTGIPLRRATRSTEDRLLGGVASGLAGHLGLPVLWVRLGFIAAATISGFGALVYAVLWVLLPLDRKFEDAPAGLAAAERRGLRTPQGSRRWQDAGSLVALAAVGLGAVIVVGQTGFGGDLVFWPFVLAAVGLAVLWRQADEAQRARWADTSSRLNPARAIFGGGGLAAGARLIVGAALLVTALAALIAQSGNVALLDDLLLATVVGVVGIGLIVWPWIYRLTSDLSTERRERIRSQERADMAAHLHDSVLQTLAMIQTQSGDPRRVAKLARAQERDLRRWLYDEVPDAGDSLATVLRIAAAEVEDTHDLPVEVVTVGDRPLDDDLAAMGRAAREAMLNAAKHSGADKVDVFAEIGENAVEVFVRDRGVGFDPAMVPEDRYGVRGSIISRMERHRGEADVRSSPGEGTEIRLKLNRREGNEDRS